MEQNMACPLSTAPPIGPPQLQGHVARGIETYLAGGLYSRCHTLWCALYGANSDFDDCVTTLAGWLGHGNEIAWEQLDAACETINNAQLTWVQLRKQATRVFYACYQDEAIEHSEYDSRRWQQVVYDTQYLNGQCQACAAGLPGTYQEHQELTGWVIHGQTTWQKIIDIAATKQNRG